MPDIYIIAGPNGAGKTTASKVIFPDTLGIIEFVNADEIARGISPFNWDSVAFQAGRFMIKRIHQLLEENKNFAFETTLSAKIFLEFIKESKRKGYNVTLIYLWLNNVQIAKERVAKRVSEGGHNIPEEVIERRYYRGIKNLKSYLDIVDSFYCFDNSNGEYELITKYSGQEKTILNFETWKQILK